MPLKSRVGVGHRVRHRYVSKECRSSVDTRYGPAHQSSPSLDNPLPPVVLHAGLPCAGLYLARSTVGGMASAQPTGDQQGEGPPRRALELTRQRRSGAPGALPPLACVEGGPGRRRRSPAWKEAEAPLPLALRAGGPERRRCKPVGEEPPTLTPLELAAASSLALCCCCSSGPCTASTAWLLLSSDQRACATTGAAPSSQHEFLFFFCCSSFPIP